MTQVWKWPAGVLGLVIGLVVLVGFAYAFLAIGVPVLKVSWWGLIYLYGPAAAQVYFHSRNDRGACAIRDHK